MIISRNFARTNLPLTAQSFGRSGHNLFLDMSRGQQTVRGASCMLLSPFCAGNPDPKTDGKARECSHKTVLESAVSKSRLKTYCILLQSFTSCASFGSPAVHPCPRPSPATGSRRANPKSRSRRSCSSRGLASASYPGQFLLLWRLCMDASC